MPLTCFLNSLSGHLLLWAAADPPLDTPLGQCLLLGALFVVGSLFGSFANVVIYRLPAGQSLLWPGSHCPRCGHAIRWHDNVPVFGWLLLNGKCRDCAAPISARYPLVEALFGLILAALGWLQYVQSGANLPAQLVAGGPTSLPPSAWLQAAYHMLLVGSLLVAGLIEWDDKKVPDTLFVFALACALVPPLFWSALRPDSLPVEWPGGISPASGLRAALEGVAGIAAGLLMALLAWPAIALSRSGGQRRRRPAGAVLASITVGAYLGWQGACGIAVLAVGFDLAAALASCVWKPLERVGYGLCLALASCVWLLSWGAIAHATEDWHYHPLDPLLAAAGTIAILALVDRRARKKVAGADS